MSEEVFQQNLDEKGGYRPGAVFVVKLLFREPAPLPADEAIVEVLARHVGAVEARPDDGVPPKLEGSPRMASFSAREFLAKFKDGQCPPLLSIWACSAFDGSKAGAFERSQMWDHRAERDAILDGCRYAAFATDMLAGALPPKERMRLDVGFLEALAELFPTCEGILVHSAGKLLTSADIRDFRGSLEDKFVKFAVNARFFNIQGGDDMLVDTLGMGLLYYPDLQYHFHGMDPNWVVGHAYNVASYILANDNPIKSGDPIDGVVDGRLSQDVMWRCRYEDALIQPPRPVIDIYMNEYAAGRREDRAETT